MQLTTKRWPTGLLCLCMLAGCARSAVEALTDGTSGGSDAGTPSDPLDAGRDASADERDAGSKVPKDSGMPPIKTDAGMLTPDAGTMQCTDPALSCAQAISLGELDASDSAAKLTHQAKGSGWFAVDMRDGDQNAMGNTRIGVSVKLSAPAGSTYSVTLMGDTSPSGGGRCVAADVSDTDPLDKTAIWGSYGPTTAMMRVLAVHVEHLSGPCDAAWTLTVVGNPCPELTLGFGEDSLGSCP